MNIKIGMFDSGIGGLSVLKSFIKKYPNNEYFYYGDTINIPYGTKSKEELLKLSFNIIEYLKNKSVDIIVIACGTISSNIYEELKTIIAIPLINIISSTINYVNRTNYKNILVLATPNTVSSHVFKNSISNKRVIEINCKDLVLAIENNESVVSIIKEYLKNIDLKEIDAVILGCTHFPIIKTELKEYLKGIPIINMAQCLVNDIKINSSVKKIDIKFSKSVSNKLLNKILNG